MTDDEARDVWAPPSGPARDPGPWRIIRARRDRGELDHHDGWLGGVCAGLATSIGADVLLVRLAFVLAGAGGFGILAYVGLWLFTPRAGENGTPDPWPAPKSMAETIKIALFVSAIVGLLGGVRVAGPLGFGDAGGWIGLALIAGGAVWLIRRNDRATTPPGATSGPVTSGTPPTPPPGAPGASGAAPSPSPSGPEHAGSSTASTSPVPAPTAVVPGATATGDEGAGEQQGSRGESEPGETAPLDATLGLLPPPGRPPDDRRVAVPEDGGPADSGRKWGLAPAVLAWVGVLAAIGLMLAAAGLVLFDAADVPRFGALVAVATAGTLVMIVAAASRRGAALYGGGAALIAAAAVAGAIWGAFNGPVGSRDHRVDAVADLRPGYEVAVGELGLDLADLDLDGGDQVVGVTMGIGRIDVIAPDDVDVRIDYEAQLAGIHWGNESREGWDSTGNLELPPVDDATATLRVDAGLGAGELYVCRAADADRATGQCHGD